MSSSATQLWESMRKALQPESFQDARDQLAAVVEDEQKVYKSDVVRALFKLARRTGYWTTRAFGWPVWVKPDGS